MGDRPQNLENHTKLVPMYHYVTFALVLAVLMSSVAQAVRDFSIASVIGLCLALALLFIMFFARLFALGVQDRVIRLEERMRMERLLPDDLRGRIAEISTDHLVGLRFASDAELPDLTRRVLACELTDRKAIKAAVRDWRADHQRI